MRRLVFLALLPFALAASACHGPCRQLSEKLCDCALNSAEKDACLRKISSEETRVEPTEEDDAVCAELIDGCDCHAIDTPQGKKACGLSRE